MMNSAAVARRSDCDRGALPARRAARNPLMVQILLRDEFGRIVTFEGLWIG
jgi:hypothetical protein